MLHVLDHSWPVMSGYSIRSRNLVTAQHRLGQAILVVTGPLHELDDPTASDVDGGWSLIQAHADRWRPGQPRAPTALAGAARVGDGPALAQSHFAIDRQPAGVHRVCSLSGFVWTRRFAGGGQRRGLPFVYEVRAFWEDAAVDQKRTRATSLRYRLTRGLETYVARKADAVAAIAQPMLDDLRHRGLPAEKLFHVPNGVDADRFRPAPARRRNWLRNWVWTDEPVFGFFGSLIPLRGRCLADSRRSASYTLAETGSRC